jgi:hypothetical protein
MFFNLLTIILVAVGFRVRFKEGLLVAAYRVNHPYRYVTVCSKRHHDEVLLLRLTISIDPNMDDDADKNYNKKKAQDGDDRDDLDLTMLVRLFTYSIFVRSAFQTAVAV